MTRYIIVGHARSGTSVTHHLLMDHSEVSAVYDEVDCNPFFTKGIGAFTHGLDKESEKQKSFLSLFDAITQLNVTPVTKACGLKTAINNPNAALAMVHTLQENMKDIKIIIVVRNSLVDLMGSIERAKKTGNWHSWQKNIKKENIRFSIPKDEFIEFAINSSHVYEILSGLQKSHEVIFFDYEKDISPNNPDNYNKLYDFLNLSSHQTQIPLKKVAPTAEEYLINYKELKDLEEKIKNKEIDIEEWQASKRKHNVSNVFKFISKSMSRISHKK